jgi:hypothetical protein
MISKGLPDQNADGKYLIRGIRCLNDKSDKFHFLARTLKGWGRCDRPGDF